MSDSRLSLQCPFCGPGYVSANDPIWSEREKDWELHEAEVKMALHLFRNHRASFVPRRDTRD